MKSFECGDVLCVYSAKGGGRGGFRGLLAALFHLFILLFVLTYFTRTGFLFTVSVAAAAQDLILISVALAGKVERKGKEGREGRIRKNREMF